MFKKIYVFTSFLISGFCQIPSALGRVCPGGLWISVESFDISKPILVGLLMLQTI